MNLVDIERDVKAISHLDFDLTCQMRVMPLAELFGLLIPVGRLSDGCQAPAVGFLECRGCAAPIRVCEQHRAFCLGMVRMQCAKCGRVGDGVEVWSFESLKVHS